MQRLQWVDGGHHGAAFEPCSTDGRDRNTAGRTASPSDGQGGGVLTLQLSVHVGCSPHICSFSQRHIDKQVQNFGSHVHLLTSHADFYATVRSKISGLLPSTVAGTVYLQSGLRQ